MFRQILLLLAVCGSFRQAFALDSVQQLIARIDHRYDRLASLEADFRQTYSANGMERQESGKLLLKRPGKMRWDYQQPQAKLFLSDGRTAWFYVQGEPIARRAPISNLDDLRSPLRFLLGKTKLEKQFEGLELTSQPPPEAAGDLLLRGRPRGMTDRVQEVTFEVSPEGQIRRIVISEIGGARLEFEFTNQVENPAVSDERFRFSPPPGVTPVETPGLTGQP